MFNRILITAVVAMLALSGWGELSAQSQTRASSALIGDTTPPKASSSKSILSHVVSLSFQETPLPAALARLERVAGINLTYMHGLLPLTRITLNLQDVTVGDALALILKDTGLDYFVLENGQIAIGAQTRVDQETGTITGRVTDARTKNGLPGANVTIVGTGFGAASDADGYYR
ncbi:MAG: carboxypeptidase-like regulatory domain-containing protein, partial [Ignavibacteriales bacterium]|nr:carboxypeptidase-like regulatory domain-containing protein [Ignavibacteriales bacterium]